MPTLTVYLILIRAVGKNSWFNSGEVFDTLADAEEANRFNRASGYQYRVVEVKVAVPCD